MELLYLFVKDERKALKLWKMPKCLKSRGDCVKYDQKCVYSENLGQSTVFGAK